MGKIEEINENEVTNLPVPADEFSQIIDEATAKQLQEQYLQFRITTKAHYDTASDALKRAKKIRTSIESRRVALKEPALKYGKFVDAEARRFTALVLPVEEHLAAEIKKADDAEAARLKEIQDARITTLLSAGFKFDGIRYVANTLTVRLDHLTEMAQDAFDTLIQEGTKEITAAREEQERKDREAAEARKAAAEAAARAAAAEEEARKLREQVEEQQRIIKMQQTIISPAAPEPPLNTMREIPISRPVPPPPSFDIPAKPAAASITPADFSQDALKVFAKDLYRILTEDVQEIKIGDTVDMYSFRTLINPVEWREIKQRASVLLK